MPLTQQSGFSFPMIAYGRQGRVRYTSQDTVSLISFSIKQILLTMPGERFWNPTFGCLLRRMAFDSLTETSSNTAKSIILQAIAKWERRVTVTPTDIIIKPSFDTQSSVTIQVSYTVNNPDFTNSRQSNVIILNL